MQPLDSDSDVSLRGSWSTFLEDVFDEHAELRDVIVQMQETADLGILCGLLERLHALLHTHFEREEHDEGMLRMIGDASPEQRRAAKELLAEHPRILSAVRDLIERVQANDDLSVAAVESEATDILKRLNEHDTRQTELLRDTISSDLGIPRRIRETRSRALEVNLRRTAVAVVIPEEQKVLLEVTADHRGVHENTKKLLWEINHRYVGWAQTLEDLHRRAMGDFAHHVAHERAADAIGVLCDLYARVAEQASPPGLRETAVRKFMYYLEKVAREAGDRLPRLLPPLDRTLDRLGAVFQRDPRLAAIASPRLKRFAETLLEAPLDAAEGTPERSLQLLSTALREVYARWLAHEDPAAWWREQSGAGSEAPIPEQLAAISHARMRECLERLDQIAAGGGPLVAHAETLLALPDNAQIERGYLDAAGCVESEANERWQNQLERIHWLIRVLSVEALAPVHEQALSEISRAYVDVLGSADRVRLERIVRETFAGLRRSGLSSSQAALNLISKIGLEVLGTGDPEWFGVVVDELLDSDFPNPDFSGFTDEWRVQINPAHLRAIRTYLSLIEGDPELARPLITALIVHLKVGGVFIADTDLFQKDISRLLNSNIGPVYHQVKHLLKIFPAYFNDIGAEGELREVSSHIDEIRGRKDPLCHFLRKQSHVESNPLLIRFIHEIGRFWATGEREPLLPYVPSSLYEGLDIRSEEYAGLHQVFDRLVESDDIDALFELAPEEIERRLARLTEGRAVDREKTALLFKLRRLIGRKYEIDHDDLLDRLSGERVVSPQELEALRKALIEESHQAALEILLDVLERLKEIVTSEEKTEGREDVYHKRHIAVGIPSMYGRYREEKFEAIGLTFRIESLANALFERMLAEGNLEFVTRRTLHKVAAWLRLILRALRVDGFRGRGQATGIAMLDQALLAEGFRVDQYINIFQLLSHSLENMIRIRFLDAYGDVLERILHRLFERGALEVEAGSDAQEGVLKISEGFFRDLIAESFGLQQFDNLVGKVLRAMVRGRERFDRTTLSLLMTYDAGRSFVEITPEMGPHDGAIFLGNKGYAIKRLARDGMPIPDGFIVTTEIFRCREAMRACEELESDVQDETRRQVARLERLSDSRFGDPQRPLLLSVRSGSAISMPGILDTFLNVGMTVDVAEGFAKSSGSPWAAWDAYRRFIQGWGMGHGIDRDSFDALMREGKQEVGVAKKSGMAPEQMKSLALRYRDFVLDRGVAITDDPFEQLKTCMDLVLASWHSETAQSYRNVVQIAEEWGTAVVVQSMVYGNLSERSSTGVALTFDPRRSSGDVRLYGDFAVQGQGDDVVSGLVATCPISEKQRLTEAKGAEISLEKDFPRIYESLNQHARALIHDHGMFHQEIEFTFESDDPADLFILQARDASVSQSPTVPVFVPSEALERAKVATGIGVVGGALSGRVAHTIEDITLLRERYPGDPILLQLAGHAIAAGDFISIDGTDGSVYLGKHPSTTVRRQRLA
jgi:pyruvate,orthophosphate dikinase